MAGVVLGQLGEWEQHPGDPNADPGRLIGESLALLVQPYRTFPTSSAPDGMTMPMWTGSGLALAVMWLGGRRYAPALGIGLFLSVALTGRILLAPSVALGSLLEACVGI